MLITRLAIKKCQLRVFWFRNFRPLDVNVINIIRLSRVPVSNNKHTLISQSKTKFPSTVIESTFVSSSEVLTITKVSGVSYFVKIWFRLLSSPLKLLFQEFISRYRETMEWRTEGVSKLSKHCWSLSCGGREQQVNIALATVLAGVQMSKDKDSVTVHGESDATSYVKCRNNCIVSVFTPLVESF